MATSKSSKKPFVVVVARTPGTNWARVFAGTLEENHGRGQNGGAVTLTGARQALYYAKESNGEGGLATNGPRGDCRITAAVARVWLDGVSYLAECGPEAVKAWVEAPVYGARQ